MLPLTELEVFEPIVGLDAIDVVHGLVPSQWTSQRACHHGTVLGHITAAVTHRRDEMVVCREE